MYKIENFKIKFVKFENEMQNLASYISHKYKTIFVNEDIKIDNLNDLEINSVFYQFKIADNNKSS